MTRGLRAAHRTRSPSPPARPLRLRVRSSPPPTSSPTRTRTCRPDAPAAVDWDATLAFRRHLWSHGLGVAEAMDTAQRGMGLDWAGAAELIRRSAAEAQGGRRPDRLRRRHRPAHRPAPPRSPRSRAAYEEQLALVEEAGAQAILMASRALAAAAKGPEDYLEVYGHLLRQAAEPVILHWLGPMFDPALEGYWGSRDLDAATDTFLESSPPTRDKVDGIKVSLLDAEREIDAAPPPARRACAATPATTSTTPS